MALVKKVSAGSGSGSGFIFLYHLKYFLECQRLSAHCITGRIRATSGLISSA